MDLSDDDWRRPDPALLRLRRITCLVELGGLTALALVALLVTGHGWEALAAALAGTVLLGLALSSVERHFRAWGYAERDDDLLIRRGVLIRRTSVVPYGRMQYVDVVAGPWDRHFGIASVVLHTAAAATDATIPGLRTDEAARLRDRLVALGEARAAGV